MKNLIELIILTLMIFFFNPKTATAQCHIDDWTALKALYESTDGDNWSDNTGWQEVTGNSPTTNCNLDNLKGVDLNDEGRVVVLWLSSNQMIGGIPAELGNLSNLTELRLPANQLNGNIPVELSNLNNLEFLWLHSNQLSNTIPAELGNLSNLIHLRLSYNQLSGSIPKELSNLNNLTRLWLNNNQFTDSIPTELGNLSNLIELRLDNNELSGSIPSELGNLSNLTRMWLYSNELNGNIPAELGDLSNLIELRLYYNGLSGSVPAELGNLSNLRVLELNYNKLNGRIPAELGNLSNLTNLKLSYNQLSGNIPAELGNLSNLTELRLYYNELSGSIPIEFGNLSNLKELALSNNQLSGSISAILGNLYNLTKLWLYSNQLNGNIPSELGNLDNLEELWLHNNNLNGNIPPNFENLSNLVLLAINDNNLSGCYPANISTFCTQLTDSRFEGNPYISDDNNFIATWEDFCASNGQEGGCIDFNPPNTSNVWPGDINNDGTVNNADRSIHYLFFNESGAPRTEQGINWQAYQAVDWGIPQLNGNDIKHFDCDGNGFINSQDNNAITLNWGLTHNEGFENPNIPNSFAFTNPGTDYQIYLRPTNQVGNPLIMDVVLESIDGSNLNLFGSYFTIDYQNINTNITNAVMNFSNSWLGIPNINLMGDYKNFPANKKVEIAFSKTNGVASLGNGVIGQVAFQIDNSNFNLNPANPLIIDFYVNQIGAHDVEGNLLPIEDKQYSVNIGNTNCPANLTIDKNTSFQNLYKSTGTIATDNLVIVGQNQQVEYRANRITLTEGFSVRAGSQFKVRFGGCN